MPEQDRSASRLQTYHAPGVRVTFDPEVCIHSGVCLQTLPAVFGVRRKRWIRAEAASPTDVAAAVHKCPSGALQVWIEGATEENRGQA